MNNAGTVLLTLADMSVIQAEVEVDETNIPSVQFGQKAKITIDALPDRTFNGHVTEIGNSPIQAAGGGRATRRRRRTSRWWSSSTSRSRRAARLHLHGRHRDGDAEAGRRGADSGGGGARADLRRQRRDRQGAADATSAAGAPTEPAPSPPELKPGQTRKETEGVFVLRDGRAEFVPIKVGIAGDRYFEVLCGPQGRRRGDHRSVQLGPRHGRRRSGEGRGARSRAGRAGRQDRQDGHRPARPARPACQSL